MKRTYQTISFLLILINFPPINHVFAQTTNITPSPSPSPIETITESAEIDKIRQVVRDKVREKLESIINKTNTKTGWLGKVINIQDSKITIQDIYSQDRIILTDPTTDIVNSKKQAIAFKDIKIDQIILTLGYLDTDSNLSAKRIIVTNTSLDNIKNTIVFGTITDVSKTTGSLSLVTKDRKVYQIKSDKNSKDLIKNQKVLVVIKPEKVDSQNWIIIAKKVIGSPTPTPSLAKIIDNN